VDLWLRKEIAPAGAPKEKQPGVKFENIPEGSFLGAARYHQKHYDFKNKPIPPGLYTVRTGIQPRDGDHLGVSETRDFAILCPPAADRTIAPVATGESVKLSRQVSGTKHPVVLWLKEMEPPPKGLPALVHQEDKDYQVLDFQIPLEPGKPKAVRMGLVLSGSAADA
jgi:hypothetical protein